MKSPSKAKDCHEKLVNGVDLSPKSYFNKAQRVTTAA